MTDLLPIEIWNEVRSHLWTGLDQAAFRVVCRAFALHDPGPTRKGGGIERAFWARTALPPNTTGVNAKVRRAHAKARLRLATLATELDSLIPHEMLCNALAYGGAVANEEVDLNLEVGVGEYDSCHIRWILDLPIRTASWVVAPYMRERRWPNFAEARADLLRLVTEKIHNLEEVTNTGAWW